MPKADDTESMTVYNSSSMLQILCDFERVCVCRSSSCFTRTHAIRRACCRSCVCCGRVNVCINVCVCVCVSIKFVLYTCARTCTRLWTHTNERYHKNKNVCSYGCRCEEQHPAREEGGRRWRKRRRKGRRAPHLFRRATHTDVSETDNVREEHRGGRVGSRAHAPACQKFWKVSN